MSAGAVSPPVPFLDLGREYQEVAGELEPAVLEVLRSQRYVLGPAAEQFEAEVARHVGVEHALGVSSGSDALMLALVALDVGPGDEVVTSPFTFFSTASAIVRLGASPIFVDIGPDDFLIDPAGLESVLNDRTRAILPVHLYGQCVDFGAFDRVARRRRIALVEDAAQAMGARRGGFSAGAHGDLGCFSFYPTKNLAACGEAGLVTTNDDHLAARVRLLRDHGSERRYEHRELGWNARLDGIQAAALSVKLRHLDDWNRRRARLAGRYDELLGEAGLDGTVRRPAVASDATHVFHQYALRVPRRDDLQAHLTQRGVGTAVHYPTPVHLQPVFESLGYGRGDLPEAERAAAEVLCLPVYPQLREDEQDRVVAEIAAFYR